MLATVSLLMRATRFKGKIGLSKRENPLRPLTALAFGLPRVGLLASILSAANQVLHKMGSMVLPS